MTESTNIGGASDLPVTLMNEVHTFNEGDEYSNDGEKNNQIGGLENMSMENDQNENIDLQQPIENDGSIFDQHNKENNTDPKTVNNPQSNSTNNDSILNVAPQEHSQGVQQRSDKEQDKLSREIFDTEAWTALVHEAQFKDINVARPIYEEFLKIYPTAGRYWKQYIEHELSAKNFDNVEKLFQRCLRQCLHIDLWKTYIRYILDVKAKLPNTKEEIIRAFEFALAYIGLDINANQIWSDYIAYVKSLKTNNQYEESQKMDALRKLYQRAIEQPMHNLEAFWKEYDQFENGLNKILAKALLNEHAPKYMAARAVYRERKNYFEGISRNMLARPPRGTAKERQQVQLWKRLLGYEKTNPQRLDKAGLKERVAFTYNQCLLNLYYYPEIWYDAANWQLQMGDPLACIDVLQRATKALPDCLLLHFHLADFLESQGNIKKAREVYENLLKTKCDPLLFVQYMRFARRTEGEDAARTIFFRARKANCSYHVYVAAALMEYHINKNFEVARKIFELGVRKFSDQMTFIFQYIDFMMHTNDDNNTRAVFENVLATIPKERALEVWDLYLKFEQMAGNLNTIQQIEKRRAATYPDLDTSGIYGLVQRYQFLDIWPCAPNELDSFVGTLQAKREQEARKEKEGEGVVASQEEAFRRKGKFPLPDMTKLMPFKPDLSQLNMPPSGPFAPSGLHPVLQHFVSILPRGPWEGPFVDIQQMLKLILEIPVNKPVQEPVLGMKTSKGTKRKMGGGDDESDEETESTFVRQPPRDIYRERMQAKLSKTNTTSQQ